MTDKTDNANEEHVIPVITPFPKEAMRKESEDDFSDDDEIAEGMSSEELSAGGELTPNDIFGLDPLDVLTLEELADYLKVSAAAAHRVIKEQKLPGRNIGGEWRFLRDAVANWLRGQEEPARQQQKAREDYSKPKVTPPQESSETERYTRPPQRPYQSEQSGGGDYRSRQRYPEGGQQYGNQGGQGGGQYGNRGGQSGGGGQYGGGGGQYGGGGGQYGSGNYGGGSGSSESRPPRRPFRSTEGGGQGAYGAGGENSGAGGYGGGGQGARTGGGGYAAGGQRFSGGPKHKNKRQVFDNERGKRLDRRKEGDASEDQQ